VILIFDFSQNYFIRALKDVVRIWTLELPSKSNPVYVMNCLGEQLIPVDFNDIEMKSRKIANVESVVA
jgi:adenosine/AMP kinase